MTHIKITEANKYPTQCLKRDPEARHMYTSGEIKILTVEEYHKLRDAIPKPEYKTKLDILLITGMRYEEYLRLYSHPELYLEKRNIIHLTGEAQKKARRKQPERTIQPLPSMFSYLLKDFWQARRPPCESVWNRDLQRWSVKAGISPYGLSAKTTRKSIESWQVAAGIPETTICLRAGHDSLTSMRHYQGLAFSDDEIRDIQKQLKLWGILK